MKTKVESIRRELSDSLHNCHIKYEFSNELHKFHVECVLSHWLYVAWMFVDDHTIEELLASVKHLNIAHTFRTSDRQRWLFLSESGIREVSGDFGRGHAF